MDFHPRHYELFKIIYEKIQRKINCGVYNYTPQFEIKFKT